MLWDEFYKLDDINDNINFFLKFKWFYSYFNFYRYFDIILLSIIRYDGCNIKEELVNSILK